MWGPFQGPYEGIFWLELELKMLISYCNFQYLVALGFAGYAPGGVPKSVPFSVRFFVFWGPFWGSKRSPDKSKTKSKKTSEKRNCLEQVLDILGRAFGKCFGSVSWSVRPRKCCFRIDFCSTWWLLASWKPSKTRLGKWIENVILTACMGSNPHFRYCIFVC